MTEQTANPEASWPCVLKRKEGHERRDVALTYMKALRADLNRRGETARAKLLNVFKCPFCGLYHVGKKKPL